jgi:pilus assembly protein CpaB
MPGGDITVATLMVTSEESERLALSTDKGHILLALRGLGDEVFADTRGITPPVLLLTSAPETKPESPVAAGPSRARRRELARNVTPAPEPKEKQTIEILRGDLFEKRSFDAQEKRP